MIADDALSAALAGYLPRQRWFGGDQASAAALRITSVSALRDEWPGLMHVLLEVPDHGSTSTYQVLIGLRPGGSHPAFLEGKSDAVIGQIDSDWGPALAYDAPLDPELALCLLERVAPEEHAERARVLGVDQSNTCVVFDERLIMKVFRRVDRGPNPDVEVPRALAAVGFGFVPQPVGQWQDGSGHLAVVSEFLIGGVDGFQLALTSLRDLYDARVAPYDAGGDFGPDASRLGTITAQMHLALAEAFATSVADTDSWADDMATELARVDGDQLDGFDVAAVRAVEEGLRSASAGPAIRVHGDFHLGQVMRTDTGWHVLDFEGEPARPLEERRRPSSALRDVAGMLRSFHYAAEVGLREYGGDADEEVFELATEWERHNRERFLEGYMSTDGIEALLPADVSGRTLVLAAFELDKAVYEIAYEASHRPEWVGIPLSAVQRIIEDTPHEQRPH